MKFQANNVNKFYGKIEDVEFKNPNLYSAVKNLLVSTSLEKKINKINPFLTHSFIEQIGKTIEELSEYFSEDFFKISYLLKLDFENNKRFTANGLVENVDFDFLDLKKLNYLLLEVLYYSVNDIKILSTFKSTINGIEINDEEIHENICNVLRWFNLKYPFLNLKKDFIIDLNELFSSGDLVLEELNDAFFKAIMNAEQINQIHIYSEYDLDILKKINKKFENGDYLAR